VKLFPNVRKLNTLSSSDFNHQKKFNKRFLFIGQIKRSKGIVELIEVFDELGADYSLEIYGMIKEKELDFIKTNSNYKGSINHSETDAVYRNNDVLVLPTYYEGEGYPGAIIEAFANSLPVITTNWMSIPEIVNDDINGILIKPMSKKELKEAILSFDNYNYKKMSKNSYLKSKEFDTNKVHDRIFSEILLSQHLY
jgi:glycosyltransferase involved in cell wall biosynthesis